MPSSDEMPILNARLAGIEKCVNALITAMNLVIDTLQQQTLLLAELSDAAKETPKDSPVVDAIDKLTSAVVQIGDGIEVLTSEMGALPDRLKAALVSDDVAASGEAASLSAP